MGAFVNARWLTVLSWIVASVIVALNLWLLVQTFSDWLGALG